MKVGCIGITKRETIYSHTCMHIIENVCIIHLRSGIWVLGTGATAENV